MFWILVIALICIIFFRFKRKNIEGCSLDDFLREKGINLDDKFMYDWRNAVPGVPFEEVVINRMNGSECIGKEWYRKKSSKWEFYKFRDRESIWNEMLNKYGYTPEEGVAWCKCGCKYDKNKTWIQKKNELIKDRFEDTWFEADGYLTSLSETLKG